MAHMDIFNDRAFHMVDMTAAINKRPHLPTFLRSQNLFTSKPVRTATVSIERQNGKLTLIPTTERGAPPTVADADKRDIRDFRTVRLAKGDKIYAHEIEGIRAFGSSTELQQVMEEVARRQTNLLRDHELTLERMRLGAVQGIVLDADNSVIRNWYTEWGITQPTEFDFELDDPATDVREKCTAVVRAMARASEGSWVDGVTQVHCLAGDDFYDALTNHPNVRQTYLNWVAAAEVREGNAFESFRYGGITFHNYRGTDDNSTVAVSPTLAKFYPVGAVDVFQVAQSPAETFDFVNTPGQEFYTWIVRDKDRNAWVQPEVFGYPLHICTRPLMLQRAKLA
jgi:hypothetical protein